MKKEFLFALGLLAETLIGKSPMRQIGGERKVPHDKKTKAHRKANKIAKLARAKKRRIK